MKIKETSTFDEVVKYDEWKMVMDDEMQALMENRTWVLVSKEGSKTNWLQMGV